MTPLKAFVLDVAEVDRQRYDNIDVYRPAGDSSGGLLPAIVFVHGGPLPPGMESGPRDWPVFVGYGSLAAEHKAVGVVAEHHFRTADDCASAVDEISRAVEKARSLPGVDPERIAMWFFSGGAVLAADWLRDAPPWLACLAFSYPVLVPPVEWGIDDRFRPAAAVESADDLPILLTRVGLERPEFASGVEEFVSITRSHGADLTIVDVPNGRHAFDMLDHTDASRSAVLTAMAWVVERLA